MLSRYAGEGVPDSSARELNESTCICRDRAHSEAQTISDAEIEL